MTELAKLYDTSHTMISKILEKNNVEVSKYKLNSRHNVWKYEKEICELYKKEQSLKKVADKYNVSESTISHILDENNIERQKSLRDDLDEKLICEEYTNGLSSRKIAKKYDCAKGTVLNILKRNNVPRRDDSSTQFKKGCVPHNKGKSKIELKGGMDYIKECILNDMTIDEIRKDVGYKNVSNIKHYLSKHNTSFTQLKKELGKFTNNSGYYRVSNELDNRRNTWSWRYRYRDDGGKKRSISSKDIKMLEKKVKDKGLPWIKF